MYVTTFIGLPIAPHILNPKCGPPKRIISQFSWSFGWEFVDLHTLLSMFSKFQVHVLKTYRTWKVLYAKQPAPDQNSSLINR